MAKLKAIMVATSAKIANHFIALLKLPVSLLRGTGFFAFNIISICLKIEHLIGGAWRVWLGKVQYADKPRIFLDFHSHLKRQFKGFLKKQKKIVKKLLMNLRFLE